MNPTSLSYAGQRKRPGLSPFPATGAPAIGAAPATGAPAIGAAPAGNVRTGPGAGFGSGGGSLGGGLIGGGGAPAPGPGGAPGAPAGGATDYSYLAPNGGGGGPLSPGANGSFNLKAAGLKGSAKGIQKQIMRTQAGLMQYSINPMLDQLQTLIQQGTSRFDDQDTAAYLAPRMEAIGDSYDQAESRLDRNLSERGIMQSSGGADAYTALEQGRADATADTRNGLYQAEEDRQRMAQAQARDYLMSLYGRSSSQAADQANTVYGQKLAQDQYNDSQKFDPLSAIGGLIGQGAGMYLGGAFRKPGGMGGASGGYTPNGFGDGSAFKGLF